MNINFPSDFPSMETMLSILHRTIEKSWKNNLSDKDIKRWLDNYSGKYCDKDDEQRIALWLLCNYTFYSEDNVNHLCKVLYNKLLHNLLINNYINKDDINNSFKNIYFSAIGSASESGGLLLYHFRQESGLSLDRFVYPSTIEPNGEIIQIFIDDATLSGGTALRNFYDYVKDKEFKKIYYITLIASESAVKKIEEKGIEVIYCSLVDERNECFNKKSMAFNRYNDLLEESKKIAETYGKEIAKKSNEALGYKNKGYLFGFYYNVPNNTLPIFWSKKNWYPIFERKEKLQNVKGIDIANRFI